MAKSKTTEKTETNQDFLYPKNKLIFEIYTAIYTGKQERFFSKNLGTEGIKDLAKTFIAYLEKEKDIEITEDFLKLFCINTKIVFKTQQVKKGLEEYYYNIILTLTINSINELTL